MSNPVFLQRRFAPAVCLLGLVLGTGTLRAQTAGQNVNMVSGTSLPGGDPFLQRQNEPSLAVSSRNPLHLLAGANDYRTVDLPGLPDGDETGDAWLGVFKSLNGGLTWTSTLVSRLPAGPVPAGSGLPYSRLCGRRGPDGARPYERPLLLQRHRLQPRQQRARRDLRGPVHRQQQQGERRPDVVPLDGDHRHRQLRTVHRQAVAGGGRPARGRADVQHPDRSRAGLSGRERLHRLCRLPRRQQQPGRLRPLDRLRRQLDQAHQGLRGPAVEPGRHDGGLSRHGRRRRPASRLRRVAPLRLVQQHRRHPGRPVPGRRADLFEGDRGREHPAVRPDHERRLPHERIPLDGHRRHRARLPRLVAAGRRGQRPGRDLDLSGRSHLDDAGRRSIRRPPDSSSCRRSPSRPAS